jgi:hypothetical protein
MADNDPITVGDIAFFDYYLPSLADDTYTISASTEISSIDTKGYFTNPITQDFEVRGPQFSLPATEVHSVYPPINGNSAYDQNLPNIVLNKRVLPWERRFDPDTPTTPWLCLLVFAEGEIAVDPMPDPALTSGTVRDFLARDDDVMKPTLNVPVPADVLRSTCSSIRITRDLFEALVPKVNELSFLAHVRQVDTGDQVIMGFDDTGWFSVIAGNRLLKAGGATRFFVHLVSLEGYLDIMSGSTPWEKKKNSSDDKDIALASLFNWTFLSQPEKLNFGELVENLAKPDDLMLRRQVGAPVPPPGTAMDATLTRLRNGYVPLTYETPAAKETFSWYRGPLVPVIAQPLPRPSAGYHFPSASSVMIYDKANGIFDQSYSAAWSLGRALALADGTFSQAMLRYRKKSYGIVGQLMDVLTSAADTSADDLSRIIHTSVVRDRFREHIGAGLGTALTRIMRNPPAAARQGEISLKVRADSPENPVDKTRRFLAEPAVRALLKEEVEDELASIAQWLAHKQLLYDVSFDHLVPDQLELPVESLRFFYIDQNWLDCLLDGAISIGVQSSKDSLLNSVMNDAVNAAVAAAIKTIRDKLRGTATGDTEPDTTQEAMSGILIRSAVVSGWPGLVVKAFKGDINSGAPLKMLRMDRLSSNVLLCIFLDIPDTVMLAEPLQGLCFGVEDGASGVDGGVINLRQLSGETGKATGITFPDAAITAGFEFFCRQPEKYVLNINDGAGSVVQTMQQSRYRLNTPTLSPAQFALEMVKAPEEISFTSKSLA